MTERNYGFCVSCVAVDPERRSYLGDEGAPHLDVFEREVELLASLRHENALFDMKNAYGGATNLRWLYGDVRERDRMEAAMQGVEYVFHAAALKHVPLCEYNPTEAVKTNVIGTNNVLEAAAKAGVRQLVFVSTDKAVGPTSTMGASKLLAERIVRGMDGIGDISTAVVRFGNVLGSRGSLVPEIYRQVRELRRANVTDNDMTRFFMSIDLAVQLVLYASIVSLRSGGNLFVLKMPCLRIRDIIEVLRDHFCKLEGIDPAEVPIYEVGKRPGEKLHEELITLEESERTREYGPFLVTYSPDQLASGTAKGNVVAPETMAQFNSSTAVPLTKPEIFSLLRDQAKLI